MGLDRRLRRLEAARATAAPEVCVVRTDGTATIYIWDTGKRMPLEEYARRWPNHPILKCYLGWWLIEAV